MKVIAIGWVVLLFAIFFAIISQSILSIKMLQFRNQLIKSQIMNYEFSSKALREKFKDMLSNSEDIKAEIQANVLESAILNFDKLTISSNLSFNEATGLMIVNIVRKLSLKTFIRIIDEQENLSRLQYAFLLERNQRCKLAAEKYVELEKDLHDSDDLSFIRLHSGYCFAIIGEKNRALEKLERIINSNPGTHFAESAEILISVLKESERKKKEIQANFLDDHQIAKAYYEAGQYSDAYSKFSALELSTLRETYMKARSMEKIGKTQEAITEYFALSEQKEDLQIAKEANRRLLVLGKIYDAGEKLTKIAEKKAEELKDNKVTLMVNEVANLKLQSIVLERMKREDNRRSITLENKEIIPSATNLNLNELEVILPKAIENRILQIENTGAESKVSTNKMLVYLSDGRIIKGIAFHIKKNEVIMETHHFTMSFPLFMLEKVVGDSTQKYQEKNGIIDLRIGKTRLSFVESFEKKDEELYLRRKGKVEKFAILDLVSASVK